MQPCIFLQLLAVHLFPKYRADRNGQQLNTAQTGTEHRALPNVNTEETKWKHGLQAEWSWQGSLWVGAWAQGEEWDCTVWNQNSS